MGNIGFSVYIAFFVWTNIMFQLIRHKQHTNNSHQEKIQIPGQKKWNQLGYTWHKADFKIICYLSHHTDVEFILYTTISTIFYYYTLFHYTLMYRVLSRPPPLPSSFSPSIAYSYDFELVFAFRFLDIVPYTLLDMKTAE